MQISVHSRDNLVVKSKLGQTFTLLSGMPGRKKWVERDLLFQPSGSNIGYLLEHFPDAEWQDGAEIFRDNYISIKQQEQNTREEKREMLEDESGYEYKTIPFAHQKQAFLLSRDRREFAYFHEQGCGKTKVAIDNAAYLFEHSEIDRLIVVAKNGVHHNWILNEIPTHLPDRIERTLAYYTAGKTKNVEPKLRPGKLHCIAFAVEAFRSEKAQELLLQWLASGKCMFVIDESSTIKNMTAQRTKFLCKSAHNCWELEEGSVSEELLKAFQYEKIGEAVAGAVYRRIMTGTPITRGQENLYAQFYFLNPNILGHRSFYTFRNEYCIMGGFEGKAIIGYKKTEELIKLVDGHSHRVLKADCLDLPPKVYRRLPFELEGKQRKFYDAYRQTSLDEMDAFLREHGHMKGDKLEDWLLKKAQELAITKAMRLYQITCGLMPDETGTRIPGTDNPRLDVLRGELEDATGKTIVWSRFKPDLHEIYRMLGKKAVRYYGGVSEDERIEATRRFVKDDSIQFFVASSAAAYGHSLPAVGAVYHSQSSSLDIRLQSEDRCHGINRTIGPTTTYTDLEALRTTEQKIFKALKSNKEIADTILQDPYSIFMEEA